MVDESTDEMAVQPQTTRDKSAGSLATQLEVLGRGGGALEAGCG